MRHSKPHGAAVIEALLSLGRALGYGVRDEARVGRTAAVDVAWTRSQSDSAPLFIFEVESSPSTTLASNAAKVYGRPLEELSRPLYFFHLVLTGRADNERIHAARNVWAQHNYRVFRFAEASERVALLVEVITQHARLQDHVAPAAVIAALGDPVWGGWEPAECAMATAEDLGLCGRYLGDYALAAARDARLLGLYIRRLRYIEKYGWPESSEGKNRYEPSHSCEGYLDGSGSFYPGLLEVALRVFAGDIAPDQGPASFERWAAPDGEGRRLDARWLRWKTDYDNFVVCLAPVHYAWAATLLAAHPAARDWLITDLLNLLDGERDKGLLPNLRWSGVIWAAHLLSGVAGQAGSYLDVDQEYERLQEHAAESGGVPPKLLLDPPRPLAVMFEDEPQWFDTTPGQELVPLPDRGELRQLVLDRARSRSDSVERAATTPESCESPAVVAAPGSHGGTGGDFDILAICLRALATWDMHDEATKPLVEAIHGVDGGAALLRDEAPIRKLPRDS